MSNQNENLRVGIIGGTVCITCVDSTGTVINVSSATIRTIKYKKPSGTTGAWTASFLTDGMDGKLKFTSTTVNDFDEPGTWMVQAYFETSLGKFHTTIEEIQFEANIPSTI